jgi:hypothetical protein
MKERDSNPYDFRKILKAARSTQLEKKLIKIEKN